jgi:hypothetical protein
MFVDMFVVSGETEHRTSRGRRCFRVFCNQLRGRDVSLSVSPPIVRHAFGPKALHKCHTPSLSWPNPLHKCHTPSRIRPDGVTQMSHCVTHWAQIRYTNVRLLHAFDPMALRKCHTPSRIGPEGVTQMSHSVTHLA